MTTAQVFARLGGREVIMEITGASRQATNHWHRTGIPFRHWPSLRAAAAEAGIRGINDLSLASTRPPCRTAA